jgi:hypothetical protein
MRSGLVCISTESPITRMPPYSDPVQQIFQGRFPQPSRRRGAVKISVNQLRMKFFCWLSRIAVSSKASRCYECRTHLGQLKTKIVTIRAFRLLLTV